MALSEMASIMIDGIIPLASTLADSGQFFNSTHRHPMIWEFSRTDLLLQGLWFKAVNRY